MYTREKSLELLFPADSSWKNLSRQVVYSSLFTSLMFRLARLLLPLSTYDFIRCASHCSRVCWGTTEGMQLSSADGTKNKFIIFLSLSLSYPLSLFLSLFLSLSFSSSLSLSHYFPSLSYAIFLVTTVLNSKV